MKEFIIGDNQSGQRFDKYLAKLMKNGSKSFFYKMLRKKNITLNGKKAAGNEILQKGDCVKLFFSDETFEKFQGAAKTEQLLEKAAAPDKISDGLQIIYEDENVLLVNKPAGMLSQPADDGTPSLVEYITGYLLKTGALDRESLKTFHPSVCNRLDRNTSGLVAAGKSLAGLQRLSEMFRDRTLHKYYLCLVKGVLTEEKHLKGFLHKNKKDNKVILLSLQEGDALPIETRYVPLKTNGKLTLLQVQLITGRPHQIRAHLSGTGHPILGDPKYGDRSLNRLYQQKYGLKHQLLHAFRLVIPENAGEGLNLSGKEFTAPLPELFRIISEDEHLEEIKNEN